MPSLDTAAFALAKGGRHSVVLVRGVPPTIGSLQRNVDSDWATATGSAFVDVIAVRVGGQVVRWKVDSATQLQFDWPASMPAGPLQIVTLEGAATSALP